MNQIEKNLITCFLFLCLLSPVIYDRNTMDFNILQSLISSALCLITTISLLFINIKTKIFSINKFFVIIFTLFLFILVFSSIMNAGNTLYLKDLSLYLNLFIFFLLIVVFRQMGSDELLIVISRNIISISILIISILGLLQLAGMDLIGSTVKSRPGSTLGNRIFAAEYLAIGFPFLADYLYCKLKEYETENYYLIIVLGSILVFTVYILLLRTRTAYIIIAIVALVYMILFFFRNQGVRIQKKIVLGVLGIIVILISFYLSESNIFKSDPSRNSFSKTVNLIFDNEYNSLRLRYWRTSLDMFKEKPLTGIGTGMWFGNYMKYKQLIWNDGTLKYNSFEINDKKIDFNPDINPHNVYLEILSENGIMGLILFLTIFAFALSNLYKLLKNNISYLPYFLSIISFLIFAFTSFTRDNICVMMIVILSIAFSSRINILHDIVDKKSFKFTAKIYFFITLIPLFALTFFNFQRFLSEKRYISALNYKAKVDYINMEIELDKISDVIYPIDLNCMPLNFYRGVGFYERRDFKKSLEYFRKAKYAVQNNAMITSNLASAYYQTGEIDSAKMLYNDLKQRCPLFIEPQINLLSVYVNTKKYDSAKILIKEVEEKNFDTNSVRNYLIFKQIKEYLK